MVTRGSNDSGMGTRNDLVYWDNRIAQLNLRIAVVDLVLKRRGEVSVPSKGLRGPTRLPLGRHWPQRRTAPLHLFVDD